ncbi:MAG: hypothetical protein ACE1ZB_00080 [Gammaproteobacteria bacterium]|jgi:hypothetical protein
MLLLKLSARGFRIIGCLMGKYRQHACNLEMEMANLKNRLG